MTHLSQPITALIPVPCLLPSRDLAEVHSQARQRIAELIEATTAANTKAAYSADWAHFTAWCAELGLAPLPAAVETVIAYASELPTMPNSARHGRGMRKVPKIGYSVASIERRLATIASRHREQGLSNPCSHQHVLRVLKGIRRQMGTAPRRKAALVGDHLRAMRRRPAETIQEIRDRALILVGFAGAFRRSELVGLDLADCDFGERTLTVHLRRSKTDQEGRGRHVVIHAGGQLCAILALQQWIAAAGIESGPVFRSLRKGGAIAGRLSTEGVALAVKRYAAVHGLHGDFGGHSLRAGHVTTAILRGESAHAIMAVTGHQSRAMVDRYFRDVEPHRHNSSANLGL